MRGKAFDPSLIILNKRITPAYAGKREYRRVQTLLHQDHPRLCGEKVIPPPELPPVPGSPPPMRGKVPHSFVHHLSTRITPAYAGKSLPKSWRNMTQKGSPPPMRGKEYRRYLRRNERGITPAYAGKSHSSIRPARQHKDHPRLCGEKKLRTWFMNSSPGSPPPMRGKVQTSLVLVFKPRITPAYAGKRLKRSQNSVTFSISLLHFHLVCNTPDTKADSLPVHDAPALPEFPIRLLLFRVYNFSTPLFCFLQPALHHRYPFLENPCHFFGFQFREIFYQNQYNTPTPY